MLGCEGKWAIHPSQVELANEVFTPAEHVISRTRRILEEMEIAASEGLDAATRSSHLKLMTEQGHRMQHLIEDMLTLSRLESVDYPMRPERVDVLKLLSQVQRVVAHASSSCNSEPVVLRALAAAALDQGRRHGVLLMVELGDLREGILPADLEAVAQLTLEQPGLRLLGIGTNLGCQHGIAADPRNMAELSALANALERRFALRLELVSGGNSSNLPWLAAGHPPGRINHLRLGEALLLGREPLTRSALSGLHTDAFCLVAEIIEAKDKPCQPWGQRGRTSFAPVTASPQRQPGQRQPGLRQRALLALGIQDVDPAGLMPPAGIKVVGASSDHLVIEADRPLAVGDELRFGLDYSALLRAMTSPFIQRHCLHGSGLQASTAQAGSGRGRWPLTPGLPVGRLSPSGSPG